MAQPARGLGHGVGQQQARRCHLQEVPPRKVHMRSSHYQRLLILTLKKRVWVAGAEVLRSPGEAPLSSGYFTRASEYLSPGHPDALCFADDQLPQANGE